MSEAATQTQEVTETVPQGTQTTPQKTDELSPKFAALARKERQIRQQQEAMKQREAALKAQEMEYQLKYVPKDRILKDPMTVLAEQGITQQQLTDIILNGPPQVDPRVLQMQSEIAELKKQLETQSSEQKQYQTKAYEQGLSQIRNEAKMMIDSDEAYETIKATDNVEAIVQLIDETYKSDGVIMSIAEAAKKVEDYLVEEGTKLAALKKVKAKLLPEVPATPAPQSQEKPQPQLRTLSNVVNATSKPVTDKDRRERAIRAFKGQL